MSKRFVSIVAFLAIGAFPAHAGEDLSPTVPGVWGITETGPATGASPLRRVTSTDTRPEPRETGGKTQVKLTLPSGGVQTVPRYRIVDSTVDGPDGSLKFDIANGVVPEIADIPGVFTPDLLAMDLFLPATDDVVADPMDLTAFVSPARGDMEVLAPMALPESRSRISPSPVQVELPPPLAAVNGPEEFSAMAPPAPLPGEADRPRVPHSVVRLKTPSPAAARMSEEYRNSLAPPDALPANAKPLRPPPSFQGGVIAGPEPGMRLTGVPPRPVQIASPPALALPEPPPPRTGRIREEEPLPVGEDGFTPVRELKNFFVPPPNPSLWQ